MKPIIITNFKTYPTALGENALALAQDHIDASQNVTAQFGISPNILDLTHCVEVCADSNVKVYAQHINAGKYGSSTGHIVPEDLKNRGVDGVILNHSEHRFENFHNLYSTITSCKDAGLEVICCAENADEGAQIMKNASPDMIAVEPPQLIGGDISVSTAQPELIKESVEKIGAGKVLVGAGIKTGEDVRIAMEYGAVGVLLASGVTKADDPQSVLEDLGKM